MRKGFRWLALLPALAAGGCATATTGESLRATFDAGVAAYDKGDYATAYKLWTSIDDEDIAAINNELAPTVGTGPRE